MLKLQYRLTEEELEEALLCLDYKREGRFRNVNLAVISILGVLLLADYIRHPDRFFLFVLLAVIVLLLFYLAYMPGMRRKRKAQQILKKGGEYRITIDEPWICYGEKQEKVSLAEGKNRLFLTERICVLQTGRETFALPARILTQEQRDEVIELVKEYRAEIIKITLGKEQGYEWRKQRKNN
jgi:uncharacterized membrane protein YobD (UPF0266 family)